MRRAPGSYPKIYAVVSRIPKGRVATYGQVAALAGRPRQARLVGYALHTLPADSDVPWHRVVNAAGRISPRGNALGHDELQAHLLRREGVRFVAGAIPLARFRWQPRVVTAAAARSAGTASAPSSRRGTSSSRPRRTRSRR
jgi:methylated-DNA-protein-cysteine methyltransferase-like protein